MRDAVALVVVVGDVVVVIVGPVALVEWVWVVHVVHEVAVVIEVEGVALHVDVIVVGGRCAVVLV